MPASPDLTATADGAPSATTRAYEWTRRAILGGDIDGGDLITEGEVAGAVGVSRTPVREAFLRLQAEGVLRLYPKRGALVVPVTTAEVRDVVQARMLVEPWAFARVASGGSTATLVGRLGALVETQVACLGEGDDAGFQEADGAFHTTVVAAAGNDLLTDFYRSLRDRQLRIGAMATRVDGARRARIVTEHRALVSALADGDGAVATRLVVAHIDATGATLHAG